MSLAFPTWHCAQLVKPFGGASVLRGVLVAETEITPSFGLRRESRRVFYRNLQTGELALKITVSAWGAFGSDVGEFFYDHCTIRIGPGLLPLPPGKWIDINIMKLGKGGLPVIEIIWRNRCANKNPFTIYAGSGWN